MFNRTEYMKIRRENLRLRCRDLLGGICVVCGVATDLEFDHINPETKLIEISNAIAQCWSWQRLQKEVLKCQLLCRKHHLEKSRREKNLGGGQNRIDSPKHGSAKMYNDLKCRCDNCRTWRKLYRLKLVDARGNPRPL